MWLAVLISPFASVEPSIKKEFQNRVRGVVDIYNRNLASRKIKIQGVKKISITLETDHGICVITPPLRKFSPVANIRQTFDFNKFAKQPDEVKNRFISSFIGDTLKRMSLELGWNSDKFTRISSDIEKEGFVQTYMEGRIKSSKDKTYKAGIEVEMLDEYAKISIVFFSAKGIPLKKIHLINVRPNRMFISSFLGNSQWINSKEFELIDKNGEIHFKGSVDRDDATIHFTPISSSEDELIDNLIISSIVSSEEQATGLLQERIRKTQS